MFEWSIAVISCCLCLLSDHARVCGGPLQPGQHTADAGEAQRGTPVLQGGHQVGVLQLE